VANHVSDSRKPPRPDDIWHLDEVVISIAGTFHPSRDLALRSAKGSAPDPDAPIRANPKSTPQIELRTG
jgi:hypothetical protein